MALTKVTGRGIGSVILSSDTAAGDDASMGFTAAEGLILTGQGSTNDVTIKNDADASVIEVPTGTTNVTIAGNLSVGGDLDVTGNMDMSDANLTNVGTIALDSLSGDADSNTTIAFSGSDVITITTGGIAAATFNASQVFTANAGVVSTAAANTLGATSFNDANITNVGSIALDTITADSSIVNFSSPITVGANDAGHDIILYGDTASANVTWDASADDLILNGGAGLIVPDGQLTLGSTAVSSTGAELNKLAGATVVVAEINFLDLGITAVGTAIASKAVILDSSKDYTGIRNLTITGELDAATLDISGAVDIAGTTNLDVVDIDGAVQIDAAVTVGVNDTGHDVKFFGAAASAYMLWDASSDDLILGGAAQVIVPDGQLVLGSTAVSSTAAELNLVDGITAGTVIASKAIITDSNIDITGGRNITISGELDAATGDFSGNVDVAGTLSIGGAALAVAGTTAITTVGTIGTGVWQGTAIASGYIAADAITGAKIADDAINSEHYAAGSIDTAHIAADQIVASLIADNAINSEHYTDGSIDTAHIANVNVTQAKIADQAINEAKMQISNAPTNGYVLTAQSGNTGGLTWADTAAATVATTAPSSPAQGDMWFNSSTSTVSGIGPKAMAVYNGTAWNQTSNRNSATGGTITTYGDYTVHTFTSSSTFIATGAFNVDVLVVAGGGGGGNCNTSEQGGGGGGAGGFITSSGTSGANSSAINALSVANESITVTVGAGGAGGSFSEDQPGSQGANSVFSTVTAIGGGGGGANSTEGTTGGSGGGGKESDGVGRSGTSDQGMAGGSGAEADDKGGGGGGAGQTGRDHDVSEGAGGAGLANSIRTGSAITYAGGGGAGGAGSAAGGAGGGGAGGVAGTANTGGGGGSDVGTSSGTGAKAGGSGIVIVRYLT